MKTFRQSEYVLHLIPLNSLFLGLFYIVLSFFQNVKDQILSVSGYLSIVSTMFNRKGKSILFVDNELYTHLDYFFYTILLIT